jgi:hypothetical protein
VRPLRRALALLVTTAAAVTVPLVTAAPASAAVSARVFGTEGVGLNVRPSPSTSGAVLANVSENTYVSVSCQTTGTTVNGTSVWDYLPAYRGYASDAYLWTGYDGFHPQLPRCGSTTPPPAGDLRSKIVSTALAEVGNGHVTKYGGDPSWEWCSIFATWVWRQAGVNIDSEPFTGKVFSWGQDRNLAFWGTSGVRPGDVVLYGTGPQNTDTSTHIGVVVEVRSDGALVTVEGNYENRVAKVGPRYPWQPTSVGAVYGYVRPSA